MRKSEPITRLLYENGFFADKRSEFGWDEFNQPRIRLYGEDWNRQKVRVWTRDKGRCQLCKRQLDYGIGDPHHKVKRSLGGDDQLQNLVTLCRSCHSGSHPEKQTRFNEVKRKEAAKEFDRIYGPGEET